MPVTRAIPTAPPWPSESRAAQAVALEVLLHGPISRTEVARRLNLSQGSLTRIAAPLVASGLLIDGEEQPTGRVGRGQRPLDVAPDTHHFAGLKLTGTEVIGVATNLRCETRATARRSLSGTDVSAVVEDIAMVIETLKETVPDISAVGIGLAGRVVDYTTVVSNVFLGWRDVPLSSLAQERVGLPVVIENDITALTEFEHWFGDGVGLRSLAIITVGAAVGYGAIVNGDIVNSPDAGLGLVVHWPLDPLGPVCSEGHRGCAQAMLSMPGISQSVSLALDRKVTYDEALTMAEEGIRGPRAIIDQAGQGLGRLIGAVSSLVLPELVVIGGEGARLATVASRAVQAGIAEIRHPDASPIPLAINQSDDVLWCRGAAVLAIQSSVAG